MARPILDEDLWQVIEPTLPRPRRRRKRHPGRKPIDRRRGVTGILFVLRAGIPGEHLPPEMSCGGGMTCRRYLRRRRRTGVWRRVHRQLLARLDAAGRIDWSGGVVDSQGVRAALGGRRPDRAPWTAGKPARNTTC